MRPLSLLFLLCLLAVDISSSLPFRRKRQADDGGGEPMPFSFNWEVSQADTPENGLFMRHEEAAEESNPSRTDGMYQVWFEDGRLMTVTYYVDGDSGFVPVITWEENHQPNFGG